MIHFIVAQSYDGDFEEYSLIEDLVSSRERRIDLRSNAIPGYGGASTTSLPEINVVVESEPEPTVAVPVPAPAQAPAAEPVSQEAKQRATELPLVREIFALFDADVDGRLSKEECKAYHKGIGDWGAGDPDYTNKGWDEGWAKECKSVQCTTDGITATAFEEVVYGKYRVGQARAHLDMCKAAAVAVAKPEVQLSKKELKAKQKEKGKRRKDEEKAAKKAAKKR